MKFSFPMPRSYPKNFKVVEKELSEIMETLDMWREKTHNDLGEFFNEFENLYFKAMSTKGEEQKIQFVTLYLIWCQMMSIVKDGGKNG